MYRLSRQVLKVPLCRCITGANPKNPMETPVIAVSERVNVDIIGPPDHLSNLRPVIRRPLENESILQRTLRETQNDTQKKNQEFWSLHNQNFVKQRQKYIDQQLEGCDEKRQLTADEMSDFYKSFLNQNWESHFRYNIWWYKRNFEMVVLSFRVFLERYTKLW